MAVWVPLRSKFTLNGLLCENTLGPFKSGSLPAGSLLSLPAEGAEEPGQKEVFFPPSEGLTRPSREASPRPMAPQA